MLLQKLAEIPGITFGGWIRLSWLRSFLSNLSTFKRTFLFFLAMGIVTAVLGGSVSVNGVPNIEFAVYGFATWVILGVFIGGISWIVDTLSLWRRSLARRSAADRDPALQALRERYARGELNENQFETMVQHLKEV
jgi:uncharacterized membrane protein